MHAKMLLIYWFSLLGFAAHAAHALSETMSLVPGAYIVEFADGHQDEAALFDELRNQGLFVTKRTSFDYSVFKGVSFQVDGQNEIESQEATLMLQSQVAQVSLVKNIWPVEVIRVPESAETQNNTASNPGVQPTKRLHRRQDANDPPIGGTTAYPPHIMTQVDKLHAKGISGKGIKIGMVDSGIDYTHPALGGCFGEGCLVSFGYDFIGDDFLNSTSIPQPDDDPFSQCNGHGTEVAGVVAAQKNSMNFLGTAYGSTFGAYRVTGCSGYTTNELVIHGYARAHADGVDIITVSISRLSGWNEDAEAVVAQRITDEGTVILAGSGNDARERHALFSIGAAATGLGVNAVGSVKSDRSPVSVFVGSYSGSDGTKDTFVYLSGRPVFSQNLTRPVWLVTPERTAEGDGWEVCNPLPDDTPDLSEYIVLVETGSGLCGDEGTAEEYLFEKGAEFIVFYRFEPDILFIDPICPNMKGCGTVDRAQGHAWREQIQAGTNIELTITDFTHSKTTYRYYNNSGTDGGAVSYFSSWGPTWELDPKVDVLGVGGDVLTLAVGGGFTVADGTSIATPYVAGIYALLMEATGVKDPKKLQTLLQNTASPRYWSEFPTRVHALAPVPQQGPGLAQVHAASLSPVLVSPSSVSFNDSHAFVDSATFSIENIGAEEVTYSINHSPALTVYTFKQGGTSPAKGPLDIAANADASLEFSADSVTIPAGGKASFTVNPVPPSGLDSKKLPVYSGYITLNSTSAKTSDITIPYLGVVGNMNNLTQLIPADIHLLDNNTLSVQPANTTFQSPGNLPAVKYTTQVGTPLVRLDIVPMFDTLNEVHTEIVDGVEIAGNVFLYEFSPVWNWSDNWNGTVILDQTPKDLPAGSYAFVVRALRIRGDKSRREDWVVVQTDPFRLEYTRN